MTTAAQSVVQLQVRNAHGTERIYPKNATAQLFCDLLKQKTLLRRDLDLIHALGFTVEWIPQTIKEDVCE